MPLPPPEEAWMVPWSLHSFVASTLTPWLTKGLNLSRRPDNIHTMGKDVWVWGLPEEPSCTQPPLISGSWPCGQPTQRRGPPARRKVHLPGALCSACPADGRTHTEWAGVGGKLEGYLLWCSHPFPEGSEHREHSQ